MMRIWVVVCFVLLVLVVMDARESRQANRASGFDPYKAGAQMARDEAKSEALQKSLLPPIQGLRPSDSE